MSSPRLSPELRSLAARLAVERTRATTWALAAEIRQQLRERLAAGEPVAALADELHRAVQEASQRPA